jgi:L-alanine-DL-glutamate epimerase-like enolase superfamily enzyme
LTVKYWNFNLPFRYPFTISKGTKTHQAVFVVELGMGSYVGYGEAPAISYYNIPVEKMIADLESKRKFVEKFAFTDPERYWHYLHHLFPNNPFLVCALDMAGWDLWGKLKGKSLSELWNTRASSAPLTDYTIGIDTIDKMISKMKEKPWPIYKVKLGTSEDIQIIEALRQHTDSVLRVDANAGWTTEEALVKIPQLAKLGVELVEQPLAKDNMEGMKELYKQSQIPLFADESCVFEEDVEKCKGFFHGINIKLTKCSGITPARRMITKARQLDMKVMIGSMNESTIGSAAIVHLMSQVDFADADGPLLLEHDLATGLTYDEGRVSVSDAAGLGVSISF